MSLYLLNEVKKIDHANFEAYDGDTYAARLVGNFYIAVEPNDEDTFTAFVTVCGNKEEFDLDDCIDIYEFKHAHPLKAINGCVHHFFKEGSYLDTLSKRCFDIRKASAIAVGGNLSPGKRALIGHIEKATGLTYSGTTLEEANAFIDANKGALG